jgi:DNA-binding MarR family transcriptional regulator
VPALHESNAAPHPYDDFLIPLLFRAYETLFAKFAEQLNAAGTDGAQMRILAVLSIRPRIDFGRLTRSTYLGEQTAEDAIDILKARGLVTKDHTGCFGLTKEGRDRLSHLIGMAQRFETDQLAALGPVELARVKTALREISQDVAGL